MNGPRQFLLATLLLALTLPVFAAEWVRVRTPGDGDQYFYDRSKLFINGDEITYWKKVIFKTPQAVKGHFAASGLYRERIHCAEHTLKLISYLLYAADGNTIEYIASHENEAAPIIPDTLGDVFEKTACDLVHQKRQEQHPREEAGKPQAATPAPPAIAPPATTVMPKTDMPAMAPKPAPPITPQPGGEPTTADMN